MGTIAARAAELAELLLLEAAGRPRSIRRRRREALLARLVEDPVAKRFVFRLTDRVARTQDPAVAAAQLHRLVAVDGVPRTLPITERAGLKLAAAAGPRAPRTVMPLVQARLRAASRGVVVDAAEGPLRRHLQRRRAEGIVSNINVLGEAILGEDEAADRFARVLAQLRSPDVSYVSIKLSSMAANLSVLAFEQTVDRLTERLLPLYLAAAEADPPKFINLDMEEYRDLPLTVATFCRLLDQSSHHGLDGLEAGIALQAYLPDSLVVLIELTSWARARIAAGGAGIKVRLVKGANLAMERVDAETHGWQQAPYDTKAEVDANYKRLVEWALRPEHASAVRVGVASHNVFDVCFALLLAGERGVSKALDVEMLEGMADAQAEVLRRRAGGLVLYTPVAARRDFSSAIAYLTRRLEENTAPENYLSRLHQLAEDPAALASERERFLLAVRDRDLPTTQPRRAAPLQRRASEQGFENAADTDFTIAANRDWLRCQLDNYQPLPLPPPPGSAQDIDLAVDRAHQAALEWAPTSSVERRRLLLAVADGLEAGRGDAIAAMCSGAAKVVAEADTEVSEAIDFARYYAHGAMALQGLEGIRHTPRGVVVVVSPWNFPYAIPAGGVLAALAAGNAVILKPAPQTEEVAYLLARQLWQAGIAKDLVQFVAAPEDDRGRRLITHPNVGGVILTGSIATAELFTGWRPDLRLHAETSGKNAIVVTATADVDQAVRDLVRSAFSHAGQKCSAASLAIVDRRVLDHPAFLRQLRDAVLSLPVGDPSDLTTVVGPLIGPPSEALHRALHTLDPGESWLVEPCQLHVQADMRLWRPGVKIGVRPGSWFHQTECFGPVLGIMRAASLIEATVWQNQVAYGLTGGLQSLDDTEIAWWLDHVEVGNAYVNRPITGAIVRRQPFGGWKRSVIGPGAKAGGPNYVASLGSWHEDSTHHPTAERELRRADVRGCVDAMAESVPRAALLAAATSYEDSWDDHFAQEHDPSGLASEHNRFRYRSLAGPCVLRIEADTAPLDAARAVLAALVTGTEVSVSIAEWSLPWLVPGQFGVRDVIIEGQGGLADRIASGHFSSVGRLRALAPLASAVRDAARHAWLTVIEDPVLHHGRIELARWLREQTVSETRHRYGNPW